jgi:predicted Zn-dependent protease
MNPHEVDADVGLARTLMSSDKPREAIKYLRMAIESDPLNSEAHYRLASAYRSLQMTDEASKEIRLFQEIKQTKAQIRELYQQMNKRSRLDEEPASDIPNDR